MREATVSEQELTKEQVLEALYKYVAEQIKNKIPDEQIVSSLREKGLDGEAAGNIVTSLRKAIRDNLRKKGLKNIGVGAAWRAGGIVVTVVTLGMASRGGGTYVVAWGAVLFGAVQILTGIVQVLSNMRS